MGAVDFQRRTMEIQLVSRQKAGKEMKMLLLGHFISVRELNFKMEKSLMTDVVVETLIVINSWKVDILDLPHLR